MRRQFCSLVVSSAAILCAAIGCSPQQPFYFSRPNGGDHYVGVAQQIEYPDLETTSLDEVNGAKAPLTIDNPKPDSYWDLSLEEAIHIALQNSSVIRTLGMAGTLAGGVELNPTGMVGTPSSLLSAPQTAATIYIPALAEADPRFGVEAALAAFDAQLSSSIFWEKNIVPQNTSGFVSTFRPPTFKQDVGNSTTEISKTTATGDQFAIRNNIRYTLDNVPAFPVPGAAKRWPNEWLAEIQAEFRHPFLQGAGVGFNRIAGPGAIPGQANGVMIARLRTDQSLADFEASVRNLCGDVEKAYWYLYYAYRRLDSVIAGRDAALQTWRQAKARFDVGGKGGGAQEEAQARQNFLLFETTVEQAQSNLYKTENALRYMLGLSHTDGRLIRPSDEPTTAKVEFDWYDAHAEALTRSVELRRQKWVIKQRELELIAAKNYLLPRLDAVGRYSFSGMGDMLIDPSRNLEPRDPASFPPDLTPVPHSAYGAMTTGDYPSWHLGLEFRMPFGFRREMAGVRFAQLNLMRERKILQEQELELSHQLADAFRDLSQNYMLSQKSYNRWLAARREVEAVQAAYEVGTTTLDQVLDAQRRQAEAENEYYRNLVQYNLSITLVHFRKGSLLEYDGIYLAEGPWPAKAYFDARRRARHRDASRYINYAFTQPRILSQGPYDQGTGEMAAVDDMPIEAPLPVGQPSVAGPESVPGAEPVPGKQPPASGGKPKFDDYPPYAPRPKSAQGERNNPTAKTLSPATPQNSPHELVAAAKSPSAQVAPEAAEMPPLDSPVLRASHQQAKTAALKTAVPEPSGTWKSTIPAKATEPSASAGVASPGVPSGSEANSGWKSIQRPRMQ